MPDIPMYTSLTWYFNATFKLCYVLHSLSSMDLVIFLELLVIFSFVDYISCIKKNVSCCLIYMLFYVWVSLSNIMMSLGITYITYSFMFSAVIIKCKQWQTLVVNMIMISKGTYDFHHELTIVIVLLLIDCILNVALNAFSQ